ncbi:MAG: DUF333 domain-containing protein [Patescibacteria group bacterium]|nr:DUF333 domain-containing protein [Patescibacteria group bacterium]
MNQKTIIAILGVAVIFLIGTTSYLAMTKNANQPTATTSNVAQQPQPTPEAKNSFTNPNGKYSFELPSVWQAAINQYNNANSLFGPGANSQTGLGGVEIFDNQTSIDNFLAGVSAEYFNKTAITINGISGIRTSYKGSASSGEQAVLLKDGKIYNIYINSEKSEDLKALEQIFTTFKFTETSGSSAVGLANPASANCVQKGGKLETRNNKNGQYGVCLFEDNRQCEEWALFRDQCPAGGVKITGYDNDAEIFCAITGGQVEGVGTKTPMCKRVDGTYCNAQANLDGDCPNPNDPNPSAGNAEGL